MFVYRNKNTGDVVRYEHRSARLEMLPNWETVQEPKVPAAGPEPQGGAETPPAEPPGGGGGDGSGPDAGERPARSASKADWVAYARRAARDSDEEAAVDSLTKEQLIDQYGGASDG
ncbi:hypothetical protein [Streptomyces tagetis]|uniref:Uncharacterized protein n=1 Tax=Streptomyces tagetis TaxID=2820809 RepID=A0A940XQ35_9ACTN|nr:hypothetical protein [Streptomyces sp. RG38]MBQ0827708.1 hypothetical protein [Streptomyces sp. RG38]